MPETGALVEMTTVDEWKPTLGATLDAANGTTFRVWAPGTKRVELVVEQPRGQVDRRALTPDPDDNFVATFDDLGVGTRYRYLLDGDGPFPDPASRFQPDGPHGASEVVDAGRFAWSDAGWTGVPTSRLVIYELHVGTFSRQGTFAGVAERLRMLRSLGLTAIELMPVAEFPGTRNWGYDGAALFAPARAYGEPDDLRHLVDAAHAAGLAVILDVVYNHTGPDGSYVSRFSPYFFTDRHTSPWGAGINLDGEHSAGVRRFFTENALHWIHEYHVDGLRLDATHAIADDSPRHFVADLAARVHDTVRGRTVQVIAEDHRNLAVMVTPRQESGWGLDAVWADDFHHQVRRLLAGDRDGYYVDYSGTTTDIATTIRQGWFFTGQSSEYLREPRGTDPSGLPPARFVLCLQNHDQIGNRALGERLHHQIGASAYRAASALLLTLPHTPLLFMGQEWAASTPFLYFTDHVAWLGKLVTEGRRREFKSFAAFASDADRERIPDPQAAGTFFTSVLDWNERTREPHASTLRLYQTLLAFRHLTLSDGTAEDASTARALDDDTVLLERSTRTGDRVLVVARLRGRGVVEIRDRTSIDQTVGWSTVLTTEDPAFSSNGSRPHVDQSVGAPTILFHGPAAVILRSVHRSGKRRGTV